MLVRLELNLSSLLLTALFRPGVRQLPRAVDIIYTSVTNSAVLSNTLLDT